MKLFRYFLFLGATGFCGPLSLIQQMRQYFVEETGTISATIFDQAFTLIKAMPGPIAFQMAVFCGQHLYGRIAGTVAGVALLLPAFFLMILAGVGYSFLRESSLVLKVLNGFQFAVAGVILFNLKTFFVQNKKYALFWILLTGAGISFYTNILPEPVIIVGSGVLAAVFYHLKSKNQIIFPGMVWFAMDWETLGQVYKVCAIAGAIVFGTGLALLPVLQEQFVVQYHWLDLQTFNDGVTFGQMTPGQVTITATFLGYKIAGVTGALIATIGIFTMPLFHMLTCFPKVLFWLSTQAWIEKFLIGATGAVVGVLLITIFRMNESHMHLGMFWFIFVSTFGILLKKPKIQIVYLIFLGGFLNLLEALATMNTI